MGKREKKAKIAKFEGCSSSEEDNNRKTNTMNEEVSDDEEANEDLSLKIVQKSIRQVADKDPQNNGVLEVVEDLKDEQKKRKRNEKSKRKKGKEVDLVEDDAVALEVDTGFKDFCGDLFMVEDLKEKEETETEKVAEVPTNAAESNPVESSDNAVLRKLLRGPRYFDPPDKSWGACYNCGKEGHTTVNCTAAKRKKPCFVCGSFEHNAKKCSKAKDCFICKQHGHRAKDCPDKTKSSKICLKCGDFGHDMFSCRNDYCSDDLKEIQCYTCGRFGHLCCADYGYLSPIPLSCYRCGLSGHTGLACPESNYDANGVASASSCYNCGEEGHFSRECTNSRKAFIEYNSDGYGVGSASSCFECGKPGHFARECTNSRKASKRVHEQSTPGKKSKQKWEDEFAKTKHTRGGWITEDPGDYGNGETRSPSHPPRSPSTPVYRRRLKSSHANGDWSSSSRSSKRPHKQKFKDSGSNGYRNTNSASRFRDNSNDRAGRNFDDRW